MKMELGSSFMAKVRPITSLPICSTIWERAVPVMRCMPCKYPRYAHIMETPQAKPDEKLKEADAKLNDILGNRK